MSPSAPQPGESATAPVVPDAELTSALASLIGKTLDERPDVSDVHLAVGESARMRSCGRLSILREAPVDAPELSTFIALISRATVRAGMASGLLAHEGGARDFSATLGAHRLRGNLHLRAGGSLGLSLRRLRSTVPELDSLGLPGQIRRLIDRARGLLLVTGPTGSGKSTTLAALVRHLICARPIHVLTIEDPIEYRFMPGALVTPGAPDAPGASGASDSGRAVIGCVTSREIGTDTPDFASAVRAAMRQDPDVIVIGEIRDRDTMHAALAAAETGHLVLATLHTPNASETIERVLSFFPPDQAAWARSVFANALIAVLSQALLGRRRGAARLDDRMHDRIDDRIDDRSDDRIGDRIEDRTANPLGDRSADRIEDRIEARPAERKAAPGLTLVCELMVNTPAVRQQIVQGTTGQLRAIIAQGRRDGHVQMAAQLAERVRLGEIDEADARRVAHPPEEFEYLMQASMAAASTPSQRSVRTSAQMSVHWSAQNAAQTAPQTSAQTSGRGRAI